MKKNIPDEMVFNIDHQVERSGTFYAMMGCSGVLTAVALLSNSVPILIGAMVVAPLLAPIQLIAFGLVSGHFSLAFKGLRITLGGFLFAVLLVGITTFIFNKTGIIPEDANLVQRPLLEERVRPGIYSLIVPLAAGIAGTLSIVKKKMDALVGVVASVALVPAAGAGTISLITGDYARAIGGFTLFFVNYLLIIGVAIMVLSTAGLKLSITALNDQKKKQQAA